MNRSKISCLSLAVACLLQVNAAHSGSMLGAYLNNDGWDTSVIDQFNTSANKPLAVINVFTNFGQSWSNLNVPASNIVSRKAVPMITWMPTIATRPKDNLLGEISNGLWDASIDDAINNLKAWQAAYPANQQPTVLIRFGHEFNGNWYPWSNDPTRFISAWRYVYNRFAQAGVSHVEWVWCANNVDVDSYKNIAMYYPGGDVVNWTALDGYNWGSNYSWTSWSTFSQLFSIPYTKLVTTWPNKPVMIAEVASAEPADLPNPSYGQNGDNRDSRQSKEAWVKDMYTTIMKKYPAIRAVTWFNTNKELSWALNYPGNTGFNGYKSMITNSYYTGTFTPLTSAQLAAKSYNRIKIPTQAEVALSDIPEREGADELTKEAEGFRSLSPIALETLRKIHTGH